MFYKKTIYEATIRDFDSLDFWYIAGIRMVHPHASQVNLWQAV